MPTTTLKIMGAQIQVDFCYEPAQKAAMDRRGFDEPLEPRVTVEAIEAWGSNGRLSRVDLEAFSEEFLDAVEQAILEEDKKNEHA